MSAHATRWIAVLAVVVVVGGLSDPADALDAMSTGVVAVDGAPSTPADPLSVVEPDDGGGDDGPGVAPVLGGLVLLGAVFAIGLSAIRRQRAEGRRSKFPPIG